MSNGTLTIDHLAFSATPDQQTLKCNNELDAKIRNSSGPGFVAFGPERYRAMKDAGETPYPAPVKLPEGKAFEIPSCEAGRMIKCRVMRIGDGAVDGVFMHMHSGGWALNHEGSQDPLLKDFAEAANLTVISIGYRLVPEHPFPAGPEDCYDAVDWLIDHAEKEFGAPLKFIGGESAGGHLSALTILHSLTSRPAFRFAGALLSYGAYNLAGLFPSAQHYGAAEAEASACAAHSKAPDSSPNAPLPPPAFPVPQSLLPHEMIGMMDMFLADLPRPEQRRDPAVSPFFADLRLFSPTRPRVQPFAPRELPRRGILPPAFFACGSLDPLLEDTLFMAVRWATAGGVEARTRVYAGAPHEFTVLPADWYPARGEALREMGTWMREKLAEQRGKS